MRKLRYWWKYYIRPVLLGIHSDSTEGLRLRLEKIMEDNNETGS